jgi:hypothetical protein
MSAPADISAAVAILVAAARESFPDVEATVLQFLRKALQLAPGLRWHVVPINLAKE